jgi:hypothetical protein
VTRCRTSSSNDLIAFPPIDRSGAGRGQMSFAVRGICVAIIFFVAVSAGRAADSTAEPSTRPDPTVEYDVHWLEVTSAIGDISKATMALDPDKTDSANVKLLTDATDQLESATSSLMRVIPPADNGHLHVLLPRLIEIVGASHEVLHSIDEKDSAQEAANIGWLDHALLELQKSLNATTRPTDIPKPGEN